MNEGLPAMSITIVPAAERHYPALHRALDAVAREKRFLAATQAPPFEQAVAFYRSLAEGAWPQFVALQGEQVLGWVDVAPLFGESRAHVGSLGIALVAQARHQGLGARLMQAAIDRSWQRGLTRLQLTVRTDNLNARALYERFGFQHEGLHRRASLVDGIYHDLHAMALLNEPRGGADAISP
jgi:RimJ/RimL family protein N-acetyltransferase